MDRMGVIRGPLNVASGLLDLRGPPRIFGSWLQYRCKEAKGHRAQLRAAGTEWRPSKPLSVPRFKGLWEGLLKSGLDGFRVPLDSGSFTQT